MVKADTETIDAVADVAQLLADRTRLRILLLLSEGEMNVSRLVKRLGCGQPMASHHLNLLRTGGMVSSAPRGPVDSLPPRGRTARRRHDPRQRRPGHYSGGVGRRKLRKARPPATAGAKGGPRSARGLPAHPGPGGRLPHYCRDAWARNGHSSLCTKEKPSPPGQGFSAQQEREVPPPHRLEQLLA